jgi:hypothetical protein
MMRKAAELTLGDMARAILEKALKSHWPPEGAAVIRVEIELLCQMRDWSSSPRGYRVRKVEWFAEHHFKKYGLSWQTGGWMLVPQGGCYPEETFLKVENDAEGGGAEERGPSACRRAEAGPRSRG